MQKYWNKLRRDVTIEQLEHVYIKPEILMAAIFSVTVFILIKLAFI